MSEIPTNPYLVPFDGSFRAGEAPTAPPPGTPKKKELERDLDSIVKELGELQRRLYAEDHWAVLAIFQALDAAGKDSTIRAVFTGVNPTGCRVSSFKRPSALELDHDFLWRSTARLPERGTIGVFNRSYYEEMLVVRVHPEILDSQRIPDSLRSRALWEERIESIREHERHLARNGTLILKFWLHVSSEVQRERFLSRIREPEKHWKFAAADVEERKHREAYIEAYQAALNGTSRPWAPWYAIPADEKPYMKREVARILVDAIANLDPRFPEIDPDQRAGLKRMRKRLESGE
ncbi:MAG: PPK2 family polyphosphate kinase [Gemmatimonadota bacterium]